jgi:UDP-N-acetylglucosamine diphosphorylase / glucose-1-phosphate thymidylyltransferase / UDP-N-acetylgalactosamine diphosphorylase / glucosamine-1-phosphate N-acetyltransferase / galactosamine-1-phosphate N-acetyltransferase
MGDRITGIIEKPGTGKEPSDLVNIVCHYHKDSTALFQALQDIDTTTDDGYEQALAHLFPTKRFTAVPYDSFWQAVKYPWHLLSLLPALLEEIKGQTIHPTAQIHPTAIIEGNVVIGEGARVLPCACIKGPCIIGDRTIIGNNALVRGSSIGNDCVIGYGTEVKSSVLADHVWTHLTYLGDSVIGENVSFGAGTVTGNLRLDEGQITSVVGEEKIATGTTKLGAIIGNDVRIGIRTAFNPGVKIGRGTFVSSGCLLEHDLPDSVFARMKDGRLVTSPNTSTAPKPESREKYKKGV